MVKQEMNAIVQELLRIKTEREICKNNQKKFFRKYKDALGMVQESTRKINKLLNELEQFRTK